MRLSNIKSGDFSVEEVELSTPQLNTDRAGDRNSLSVEHVLIAHPIIYKHLCALFSLIMIHGHVSSEFKAGVITPVIKDYIKSLLNVDNYRPVTIISVLSKIF